MLKRRYWIAGCLMIVAAVLTISACTSSASAGSTTTSLTVDLTDFAFKPDTFTVPAGKEVTVNVTNKGANFHEFVIMKAGTRVTPPFDDNDEGNIYWEIDDVAAGTSKSGTFTAPEPGTYQIACGTPAHVEMGMVGTLTVVQ